MDRDAGAESHPGWDGDRNGAVRVVFICGQDGSADLTGKSVQEDGLVA
jgi:hypothetical protein